MIKSEILREALADLIKVKAGLSLKVFFNRVLNSKESYVWVRLRPKIKNIGGGLAERFIRVDFQIVIAPENAVVRHTDLYDIVDKLNSAVCVPLQVADRFITIYDTESVIFEDILTYSFAIDFADAVDYLPREMLADELMQNLEMELN